MKADIQKKYIKEKLDTLLPIFAQASVGNFSQDVPLPEEDDEFAELYTGIQIMLDVIRSKIANLENEIAIRKHLQADVFRKEEWFRALIEKSFGAIGLTDKNAKILYLSPSFTTILGYTPQEMIGTVGFSLVYPEDIPLARALVTDVLNTPSKSATVELRCHHKDGTMRYLEVIATNLLANPRVGAIVFNFHDITERMIVQETLAKDKAEDEAILASIGDGLIVIDKENNIEIVNPLAQKLLGMTAKELVNKPLIETIPMSDEKMQPIAPADRPLARARATGEKVSGTYFYQRKDGSAFPVSVIVTPLVLAGKIVGSIEVFRDITREKELDQAKDEFISLASHELRTPMTAIKGLVDMILHEDYGPVNENLREPLQNINISSDRQIRLITDLLNVSRLQTGKITYHLSDFSLKPVVEEIVTSLQPIAHEKNITLTYQEIPAASVQFDNEWIKHILNNLIGNALKFTEKGGVSLSFTEDESFVSVHITDTGIGIAIGDQENLFKRFRQLPTVLSSKYAGSGLGLYISREIAQKLGGDVVLGQSEKEKGSTFIFSIPKASSRAAQKVKQEIEQETQVATKEEQHG